MKIRFNTFDKVNKFVKVAESFQSDISIISGRYVINAKSIMGVYSLDLSRELELEIDETEEGEIEKLIEKLRELELLA